ncbi:MAG: dephospho-CoA kinase [Pseudomonadota bacterium]
MLIIGLTGGIGSGKSTVAAYFGELGVPVIDADVVARDVVVPGSDALREITAHFGAGILNPDGTLDRARLRGVVFRDTAQRGALEKIIHPRIYADIRRRIAALDAPYCVVVIPLLLETGQTGFVDRVLVVDSPEAARRTRVQARDGLSSEEIAAIMRSQAARPIRLAVADDIINNDGGLDRLQRQTEDLHQCYLGLAAAAEKTISPLHDPRH